MALLIEAGMLAGISYILHYQMFGKKNDREKIEEVFQNVGFGFKDKKPQHIYTHKKDNYKVYGYDLPYGLTDNPKLEYVLNKALNKPVVMEMNAHLKVKVYDNDLPTKIDYDWQPSPEWTVPIGKTLDGYIYHDFDKIPHMAVAGMTRQGKTVFLKLILAHLINNNPDVEFYILDLKGGLEFSRYERLKQIKEVSSNVDEAKEQLALITSQIKADMSDFKSNGWNNITDTDKSKRTFIIVDEAAELADSKPCQKYLSEIARIGGALGYRLVFATQYPTADTLPRQIKQNSDAKISFRLPTEMGSRVALDENGAEQIETVGRAIYRTHDKQLVQVPYISDKEIEERLKRHERTKNTQTRTDLIEFE